MQAVKQKLHIKPRLQLPDALLPKLTGRDPEADKAKLLMGDALSVSFSKHVHNSMLFRGHVNYCNRRYRSVVCPSVSVAY